MSALATAQGLICGHLVLTPQAADVLRSTGRVVTFSATDLSGEQLVAKILEGSGCTATRLSERIVIYVAGQEVEEGQIEAKGLAFEKFQIERALARPVNLTMHFSPLPFAIQMLEEISGVRIELPPQYQKRFYASQPLVSVSAHGQPLAEVLKDVARQIGAELTTDRGAIQLQIKSAN